MAHHWFTSILSGLVCTGTIVGLTDCALSSSIALEEDLRADPTSLLGLQIIFFMALIPLLGWYLRPLLQWSRLLRFLGPIPQVAAGSVRVRSAFTAALVPALVAGVGSVNAMRPRLVEDRRVLERSGAAPRLWLSVSMWALVFGIRWSHYVAFHRSR